MTRYEWDHRRDLIRLHSDERVSPGETFEPTEREIEAFGDRLAVVEAPEGGSSGSDGGEAAGSDADSGEPAEDESPEDTPLVEKHWRTAVTEIEDGEHDDRLEELAGDEGLTESVREAVEERQAELTE